MSQEKFSEIEHKVIGKVIDNVSLRKIDLALEVEMIYREKVPSHILLAFEECPKGMNRGRVLNYPKLNLTPSNLLLLIRYLLESYKEISGLTTEEGLRWVLNREMRW